MITVSAPRNTCGAAMGRPVMGMKRPTLFWLISIAHLSHLASGSTRRAKVTPLEEPPESQTSWSLARALTSSRQAWTVSISLLANRAASSHSEAAEYCAPRSAFAAMVGNMFNRVPGDDDFGQSFHQGQRLRTKITVVHAYDRHGNRTAPRRIESGKGGKTPFFISGKAREKPALSATDLDEMQRTRRQAIDDRARHRVSMLSEMRGLHLVIVVG